MDKVPTNPRWGIAELILVYVSSILLTMVLAPLLLNVTTKMEIFFIASSLLQTVIMISIVILVVILLEKGKPSELGLNMVSAHDFLLYGLLAGLILMVLMILLGQPISYLQPDIEPQPYEEMLRSSGTFFGFIVLFILGVIIIPFAEELFYRGMIYPVLRKHLGVVWGIAISGLVFGLAHWDLWRTIPLAVGGAVLCYIYEKTGSILVTALAHGTWNGLMAFVVFYDVFSTIS